MTFYICTAWISLKRFVRKFWWHLLTISGFFTSWQTFNGQNRQQWLLFKMNSVLDLVIGPITWVTHHYCSQSASLVPRPLPPFQCYMQHWKGGSQLCFLTWTSHALLSYMLLLIIFGIHACDLVQLHNILVVNLAVSSDTKIECCHCAANCPWL